MRKDGIVGKVYNTGVKRLAYYQLSPIIWLLSHLHSMLTLTTYLLGVVVVVVGAENIGYGHNWGKGKRDALKGLTSEALEPLIGLPKRPVVGATDLLFGGRVDVVLEEVTHGASVDDLRARLHRRILA